jgi:flagellar motor switch protein FliG
MTPPASSTQSRGNGAQQTSLRHAAIVIAALGEELASEVCSHLPASQVLALGDELASLQDVPTIEINQVLGEFVGRVRSSTTVGGPAYARSVLSSALGQALSGSRREMDDIGVTILSRLDDLDPALLWRLIQDEKPQTIAALLSRVSPTTAGHLLSHCDERRAADIAYRAARLSVPSPGTIHALGEALELELRATRAGSGEAPEVSLQFVVDLINTMAPEQGKQVLAALTEVDGDFGAGVAEQVFTFENLMSITDRDLQLVLRAVDVAVLAMALKGTPAELRERLKQNLSQRGKERLDEESEMLGPVPLSQVQEAQRQVCQTARQLSEAGEIGLSSAAEEYVE